jgi:hypothetical protein
MGVFLPQECLGGNLLERPDDPAICTEVDIDRNPIKSLNKDSGAVESRICCNVIVRPKTKDVIKTAYL